MAFPVILYSNILRSAAALTASSTETGNFGISNVKDYLAWSLWKSATLVTGITIDIDMGSSSDWANTLGLVNHNITSEGGTVEVKADNANPPVTVRIAAYTPTYGDVELADFSTHAASRYYRITLAKGGNFANKPYFGEIFLGNKMTLPEYLSPDTDPFLKSTEGATEFTEGGHYAGATVRGRVHGFTLAVSDVGLARSFHDSDLTTFVDGHLDLFRPFIFQLDSADSVFKKPVYVVRKGPPAGRRAIGGSWTRMGFSCEVAEAYMETA